MAGLRGFAAMDDVLLRALNATNLRQQVTANNIANADTPGFRRSFVRFEDELQRALRGTHVQGYTTDARHIPVGRPRTANVRAHIETDTSTVMRNDGNNVDIEREMALNAAAEVQYYALVQATSARYAQLRAALR